MCADPATLAIAAQVVGTVMSASAASQSGDAQASAMQYQAAVGRNNQIVAEQNATFERQKGQQQEAAQRQKTAQMVALQRARGAASGLDIGSGSPLRLQADTAELGELDALTIRNNAARAAYGYEMQADNFAAGADLNMMQARSAERAGQMGAMSSIIGGSAGVADKWLRFKNAGVFSGSSGTGTAGSGGGWIDAGSGMGGMA